MTSELTKIKKKVAKFRKYILQESGCYHVQYIQDTFKEIFGEEPE